jgi:hypothetical protein
VDRPTIGIIGERRGSREAVIPLPPGNRGVPVELSGEREPGRTYIVVGSVEEAVRKGLRRGKDDLINIVGEAMANGRLTGVMRRAS